MIVLIQTTTARNLFTVLFCGFVLSAAFCQAVVGADLFPKETPIFKAVDHYIGLKLKEAGVAPAPPADQATLLRRTTFDLVGRPPTVAEAKAHLASKDNNRRKKMIVRLMASPGFVRHQATEFNTLLMYGTQGSLQPYLERAFAENRGWDRMFREMMLGEEGDTEQKGAIRFVKTRAKDIDRLANDTSVKFFGVNVSCAKCHDHPLVLDWTQDHFFGMKSFFNRTFDNGGLMGERDYGIVKFQTTDGEQRTAKLMFLTGTVIDEPEAKEPTATEKKDEKNRLKERQKKKLAPPAPQFSRRAQLVKVALSSKQPGFFSRAIVNNVWQRLFGQGLVTPTDQLHSENEPSHPQLLDWLARDFADNGYDLRRLIEGLVSTQAYGRSSRWDAAGQRPVNHLFAVAPLRPLTPLQYAMTLQMASTDPDYFGSELSSEGQQERIKDVGKQAQSLAKHFEQPVGENFQIGVAEALLLSNGPEIRNRLLHKSKHALLERIKGEKNREDAIRSMIWATLVREPSPQETELLKKYLSVREDRLTEAYGQVIWSLLTCSENRFNY